MISRIPQNGSAWLVFSNLVTIAGLPPKDPPGDDDEEDEEPAVIREPDEC
jgi:hypothetical protein